MRRAWIFGRCKFLLYSSCLRVTDPLGCGDKPQRERVILHYLLSEVENGKCNELKVSLLLTGLEKMMKRTKRKYPAFRDRLKEKNFTAQIKIKDNSMGRYFLLQKR